MNEDEFAAVAAMIKTFYSKEPNLLNTPEAIEIWYRMLKDIPAKTVKLFLAQWFATEKWSPTIADIRQGCNEIVNGVPLDWGEAWGEVMRAVSKYGYMRVDEALPALSEVTRRTVECIGWKEICTCENTETMRAQFRQIYESQCGRVQTQQALPESVRKAIMGIKAQMALEAPNAGD